MKLSVLFLICSLSMTYAAESYAQKTMISLEVRNETVGTVLEKLKKESGFDFFFNNKTRRSETYCISFRQTTIISSRYWIRFSQERM